MPSVLLLLFLLLLLVGGGVAWIVFFPFLWLSATRIHRPLSLWRRILTGRAQETLAGGWPGSLVVSSELLLFALQIAITGYVPAVEDPEKALAVMLICLGMELIAFPLTFVSGFAYDLVVRVSHSGISQPHAAGR